MPTNKKPVAWNPDEVINLSDGDATLTPEMQAERDKMDLKGLPELPLTEEQKRKRAMRFVWGPGDLRRVR
jgi:hypothetical protein